MKFWDNVATLSCFQSVARLYRPGFVPKIFAMEFAINVAMSPKSRKQVVCGPNF